MIKSIVSSFLLLQALTLYAAHAQNAGSGSRCTTPLGRNGACIGIRQCPVLLHILQIQPIPPGTVEFLRRSRCSAEGEELRVCCPLGVGEPGFDTSSRGDQDNTAGGQTTSPGIDRNNPNPGYVTGPSAPYDLSNNSLLPTECGKDLSQRIFGGERTDIDEFPWMALLEYVKPNGRQTACGGVLISKRYVLTAAHCIVGKDLPKTWRLENVRLGEYNTDTHPDCIQDGDVILVCADDPITVGVEEQIAHEYYRPASRDQTYDIALLRLTRDVSFSNYVKPICLPPNGDIPNQQNLYTAGWGKTENRSSSSVKLKVSLPLVQRQQCQTKYSNSGVNLGDTQICAGGQKGKDSCRGDSGGPLMALERTREGKGKWSVIGVVSFGPSPCGMPGWPGVYTKVAEFVPWILGKMRP
ncbi:CLIP domain-containing serine protease HP8-like [Megalopta genalis]|uniref:CLIP domain-containing serine protease HP8-like n=1 Tax=Megalopta genalis TaxID=115081 RepID=UPI003FD1CA3B